MFQVLLLGPYLPFTIALCLPLVFLGVEVLTLMLGSPLSQGRDAGPALQPFDLPAGAEPDLAALVAASDAAYRDLAAGPRGHLGWLWRGMGCTTGPTPFKLSLLAAVTGGTGLLLQRAALAVGGAPMPVVLALPPALVAGWLVAQRLGGAWTRKPEGACGGLRGQVTQGDARAGVAAHVSLESRDGARVSAWCEPFRPGDVIAEGSAVLTVRERLPGDRWALRILPLD